MTACLLAIDWHLVRVGLILLGMGVFTVIVETIVMLLFKFDSFGKSVVDAIMANIGSLLLGILLFLVFNKTEFGISQIMELVILYFITSVFEAWLIKLLRKKMAFGRIILTSFVMNLLSFASLYLIFTQFLAKFFSP
ncbi:MAG: hypothetical protein E6H06_18190 [Bacteroidetes bacterium]|nr:MAG: hypothetical protein E6H06_18190 [Bacteroidota bacterium]